MWTLALAQIFRNARRGLAERGDLTKSRSRGRQELPWPSDLRSLVRGRRCRWLKATGPSPSLEPTSALEQDVRKHHGVQFPVPKSCLPFPPDAHNVKLA